MKCAKLIDSSQTSPIADSVLNFIEDAKRSAGTESLKNQLAQSENNFGAEFLEHVAEVNKHMQLTKKFVTSVIGGIHKNAILQGPPGLGKSHVVVQALKDADKVERQDFVIVKGHVTPGQLFVLLFMFRKQGQVIVLDDCDDVFDTELGFNMLKAALDPDNRTVSYQGQRVPVINGVAVGDFEFNGTLIFCTNVALTGNKMSRRGQHMAAILSRAVKWPLAWDTPQQKFAQIYNMVVNEDYLSREERTRITDLQKTDLLKFIWANLSEICDLDLRLPQKIAAEMKTNKDWIDTCKVFMTI